MYCRCENDFDWLMKMLKKGDCFSEWKQVAEFIDDDMIELRYMKKRFGYLFYDHDKYIKKVNCRYAIFVNKEDEFVCRKPDQPTFHGIEEVNGEKRRLNITIPMEDTERYEMKFLDEIDKGEPFIMEEDKEKDEKVKKTDNIFKKIKLVRPDVYYSDEFYEVLDSNEFDGIELEKERDKFFDQVMKVVFNISKPLNKDDQS